MGRSVRGAVDIQIDAPLFFILVLSPGTGSLLPPSSSFNVQWMVLISVVRYLDSIQS